MYADHFSLANIPFGVASSSANSRPSIVTRLKDDIIFIEALITAKLLPDIPQSTLDVLCEPALNSFAASPKSSQRQVRARLQHILDPSNGISIPSTATESIQDVTMHLPIRVSEFTDFSCSMDHVLNASQVMTGTRKAPPGFLHFPVGYAGRSSSIVVSGTPIRRPLGQYRDGNTGNVIYGPTRALDYELEVACIIGQPLPYGSSVPAAEADDHIFGLVLLNDWSARDIQGLEMIPLGPLNGKNFGTSISPWVITTDALEPYRAELPSRDIPIASYLEGSSSGEQATPGTYDIRLQAEILTPDPSSSSFSSTTLCQSRVDSMYWSFRHLVAHQTVGGSGLRTGDMMATGTVSGSTPTSHGCLLEHTKGGKAAIELTTGGASAEKRIYLEDGDQIRLSGWTVGMDGKPSGVGFGECVGTVVAAKI